MVELNGVGEIYSTEYFCTAKVTTGWAKFFLVKLFGCTVCTCTVCTCTVHACRGSGEVVDKIMVKML